MEKVSFKEIVDRISKAKYLILVCMLGSLLVGLFFYKLTPDEYSTKVQLLPVNGEEQSQQARLGTLASLAGINFNTVGLGIPPTSYEFILASSAFLLDVIDEKIEFEGDTVYIANYLTQRMVVDWKNKVKNLYVSKKEKVFIDDFFPEKDISLESNNLTIIELKGKRSESVRVLRESIEFSYEYPDPISIVVSLQDPEASAKVAKVIVEKLEDYVSQYTKDNRQDNEAFLKKETEKARKDLYNLQLSLANAKDRDININRAIARIDIERLSLRYSQARQTYESLLSQLDYAKIQMENKKPLFIVVEPPSLLNKDFPSAPRLIIYILLSLIVGGFASLTFVFAKSFVNRNFS